MKKPINKYYLGRIVHGCPYFMPRNFNRNIISIRKNSIPMVRRAKDRVFNIFGNQYWIEIGLPIKITWHGLGWKDKYGTPRFEFAPGFYIYFFHWQLCIWKVSPLGNTGKYYEQKLWLENYCNNDYNKAKETWSWVDFHTKKSTWDDIFFLNMRQIVYNSVTCLECNNTIVSYHRHDYKLCGCKNQAMVDGGTDYSRYGAKDMSKVLNHVIYEDDDFELVRKYATRGSRGKDGKKPLSYIAICDMDDDYLKSVLDYGGAEWHLNLIRKEIKYRENEKR